MQLEWQSFNVENEACEGFSMDVIHYTLFIRCFINVCTTYYARWIYNTVVFVNGELDSFIFMKNHCQNMLDIDA